MIRRLDYGADEVIDGPVRGLPVWHAIAVARLWAACSPRLRPLMAPSASATLSAARW